MRDLLRSGAEGGGFVPPSSNDFELPPIFGTNIYTTKPIALVFLSVILISVFFIISSRKAAVVPSKLQFAGEAVYTFVRNDLAKDVIGHDFMRFVPYLFTLFTFILVNNLFGIIPLLQFPYHEMIYLMVYLRIQFLEQFYLMACLIILIHPLSHYLPTKCNGCRQRFSGW